MAHLSQWLAAHDLDAADLDDAAVAWYLRDRRASGQVRRLTSRGLAPLLGYLRHLGLAPARPGQQPGDPVSSLVCEFAGFLATERGLAEGTIRYYCDHARRFLSAHAPHGDVAVLTPGDVRSFLLDENSRRGSRSLQNVVTALRALLRFLHVHGHLPAPLADGALPAIPVWSYLPLTRALRLADVARLLESCDRTTGAGRRDYAVLVLLARLGLRAGEAAALRTGDVSWRAGEILVRGKGGRQERLPLPADVGSALADYCQNSRPLTGQPFLLLQARAPYAGLSADTVTQVVMRTCRRAGLPPGGAHQLRHAAATAMRQAGAPLAEVSQVLRHRHAATTARYGTVEVAELTALTRPWPAGAR